MLDSDDLALGLLRKPPKEAARVRPIDPLIFEVGVGIRPWIIKVSGCGGTIDGAGVELIGRGSAGVEILKLRNRHRLGVEVGGGFAQYSGPLIDGGAFYEFYATPSISLTTVLGAAYWPLEKKYSRRFFRDKFNRDYDELMACAGNSSLNTYSQNWGILWGVGANFYLF